MENTINEWNALNPDIKIRSLFNAAYYALDLPNGKTEHHWTLPEVISRAMGVKYSHAAEQPNIMPDRQVLRNNVIKFESIRSNV